MRSFAIAIFLSVLLLVASVGAALAVAPFHEVISSTGRRQRFLRHGPNHPVVLSGTDQLGG